MAVIKIPFNVSLSDVSSNRGNVTLCSTPQEPSRVDTFAAERQTLTAIAGQLGQIQIGLEAQRETVEKLVTKVAAAIAREALGSDDELIDKRVAHFAGMLMNQLPAGQPTTAYVHPKCVETLSEWAEQSSLAHLTIRPDGNLPPGDARLEVGGKGIVAALEAFLSAAAQTDGWAGGEGA